MLGLCSKHQQKLHKDSDTLNKAWERLLCQGIAAHHSSNHKTAQQLFLQADAVASLQLDACQKSAQNHKLWRGFSVIDMLVIANHNLSASLCAQKKTPDAEHCLKKLHNRVSQLCINPLIGRELRIDALANLDRSLFSLTKVLGDRGLFDRIQQTIENTELTADTAAKQLFH